LILREGRRIPPLRARSTVRWFEPVVEVGVDYGPIGEHQTHQIADSGTFVSAPSPERDDARWLARLPLPGP
jgi:hypothetical protein